jgi:hypothetical protein
MPESTELTDYQKATAVARYVEIEEIGLDQVQGRLLVPRDVALSSAPWEISFEKSATFSFVENSKRLATTLSITGRVVPKNASEPRTPIIEFSCAFSLGYCFNVVGGPEGEERDKYLKAFAEVNGTYNVWPYFRELFQSTITRMGLPPVVVPLYRASAQQSR